MFYLIITRVNNISFIFYLFHFKSILIQII